MLKNLPAFILILTICFPQPVFAVGVEYSLCTAINFISGDLGKSVSALGFISMGVMAFMGKVSMGLALSGALATGTIFSAPTIVEVFSGEEEGCTQVVVNKLTNDANAVNDKVQQKQSDMNDNRAERRRAAIRRNQLRTKRGNASSGSERAKLQRRIDSLSRTMRQLDRQHRSMRTERNELSQQRDSIYDQIDQMENS